MNVLVTRLALSATLAGALDACTSDPSTTEPASGAAAAPERVDSGLGSADATPGAPDARFITEIVRFSPGACAGFGASHLPAIVQGGPAGAGERAGSFDVASLGAGGEIVVAFTPNAIVDGPGPDFIVFENAFFAAGDRTSPFAEPAEVSISEDGTAWKTFPCTPDASTNSYGACAGWHPVHAKNDGAISPFDVGRAGGEAYDLASAGATRARFVRIRDMSDPAKACPPGAPAITNAGFDLDAVAVVHGEIQ